MERVRRWVQAGALLLLVLASACRKPEEVRHYRAPKEPMWRMLAAMVPTPSETWYFKLVGPSARIEAVREEFTSFIKSLKVASEVTWDLPSGWSARAGGGERKATLSLGREEPPLEVTVSALAGNGGGVEGNIARWRSQMGIAESQPETPPSRIVVSGAAVVLVDLEGPKRPTMGAPMRQVESHAPESPAASAFRSMLDIRIPEGWVENPHPRSDRIMEFRAGAAQVTLTFFPGRTGDVSSNINRWREQAGLPALSVEEAGRQTRPVELLGREARYAEILGLSKSILCAFFLDEEGSLFLKMDGPPEAVHGQTSAFLQFVQSLRKVR